jgi:hypothetical protein
MIRTKRRKNHNNGQWLTAHKDIADYVNAIREQFNEFARVNVTITRKKDKVIVNFKPEPVVSKINISYQYPDGASK